MTPDATRSIAVTLAFESGYAPSDATALIIDRSLANRVARAVGSAAICFAFAFVCVFVPLAHFVLVPSFLVAGITLFVIRLRENSSLAEVRGVCPRCREQRVFPASGRFRDKRSLRCNQCAEKMTLTMTLE